MTVGQEWAEIAQRLREARLAAGLSQEELGIAAGLDRTMISKIESLTRQVKAVELTRLCGALGLQLGHFLVPAPAVVSRRAVELEEEASDGSKVSRRVENALFAWLRDVRQLMKIGVLAPRKVLMTGNAGSAEEAREAAAQLRRRLGMAEGPIGSMVDVAERAGVLIALTDLPGDGASINEGDLAVAIVSVQGDPGRRRATAAHELGHVVLGDEFASDIGVHASRDRREAVIDAFAAEFLLPAAAFSAGDVGRSELVELAAKYRVSWSLAVNQAVRLGLLKPGSARALRARTPTEAELREAVGWVPQPDLASVRVPPAFASAILRAQQDSSISTTRAVEMMRGELDASAFPEIDEDDTCP